MQISNSVQLNNVFQEHLRQKKQRDEHNEVIQGVARLTLGKNPFSCMF